MKQPLANLSPHRHTSFMAGGNSDEAARRMLLNYFIGFSHFSTYRLFAFVTVGKKISRFCHTMLPGFDFSKTPERLNTPKDSDKEKGIHSGQEARGRADMREAHSSRDMAFEKNSTRGKKANFTFPPVPAV